MNIVVSGEHFNHVKGFSPIYFKEFVFDRVKVDKPFINIWPFRYKSVKRYTGKKAYCFEVQVGFPDDCCYYIEFESEDDLKKEYFNLISNMRNLNVPKSFKDVEVHEAKIGCLA